MRRYLRQGTCLLLTAILGVRGLNAQTVSTDGATGDRVISYEVGGTGYQVVVPGTDRVIPELRLASVTEAGGVFTYSYRLFNRRGPKALPDRGLWMFDLPCAATGNPEVVGAPGEWRGELLTAGNRAVCRFMLATDQQLEPGDSTPVLVLRSRALLGFAMAKGYGIGGRSVIPTDEDMTPDTVSALIRNLRAPGGTGSGAEVRVTAPIFVPADLPGPISVVQLMRTDLLLMCGELRWIDNGGICRSFQVKLENAETALQQDDVDRAQNQMKAFRQELEAQRGKHVLEEGYQMLWSMLRHLDSNM